jgi:hypothetical protein
MKLTRCFVFLALGALLAGCNISVSEQRVGGVFETARANSACSHGLTRVDATTYWWCGGLSEEAAKQVTQVIEGGATTVILSTLGGYSSAAAEIVNAGNARGVKFIVRGGCLSACAIVIVMAADKLEIEPGAIVAFHHTSTQNYITFADRIDAVQRAHIERNMEAEKAVYRAHNIDERFLLWPGIALRIVCVGPIVAFSPGEWGIATRQTFVVPVRDDVERARGRPIPGWWPKDAAEINEAGKNIGDPTATFAIANKEYPGSIDELVQHLKAIPTCDMSHLQGAKQ